MKGFRMVYKWRNQGLGVKAQVVGEFIEKLTNRYNGVTPEILLKEAKKKTCPIHDCFEWDDKSAANKYRLDQARYMLRQLVIVEEDQPEIRAFVNVEIEDSGRYVTIQTAKDDPELREQVISKAYKELVSWKDRYENIQEFMGVVKAIRKVKVKKAS